VACVSVRQALSCELRAHQVRTDSVYKLNLTPRAKGGKLPKAEEFSEKDILGDMVNGEKIEGLNIYKTVSHFFEFATIITDTSITPMVGLAVNCI